MLFGSVEQEFTPITITMQITPHKKTRKCSKTAILRFSLNTQSYKHTHFFTILREEKILPFWKKLGQIDLGQIGTAHVTNWPKLGRIGLGQIGFGTKLPVSELHMSGYSIYATLLTNENRPKNWGLFSLFSNVS